MKKTFGISVMILILSCILFTGCRSNQKPVVQATAEPTSEQLIKRGEYLVATMGCNDCHSPKQMGPQGPVVIADLMLSGYPADRPLKKINKDILKEGWLLAVEDMTAMAGPWGISFAANLTSDQTGIGNWTEENFKNAVKAGWFKGLEGTRKLLPPMPWANFAPVSDEDIKALFSYLMSTKPVSNSVPEALGPDEIK